MGHTLQSFDGAVALLGLLATILLAAYRKLLGWLSKGSTYPPLPPGPPPEPILGHYRMVPEDAAFKQYAKWSKEYSMMPCFPCGVQYTDIMAYVHSRLQRATSSSSRRLAQNGPC